MSCAGKENNMLEKNELVDETKEQLYRAPSLSTGRDLSARNWLEHAIDIEVYGSQSTDFQILVNDLFSEISQCIKITSLSRYKEALKLVLINLWKSRLMDAPVKYSRDRNWYVRDTRYGMLFFKYDRLIPIIDALHALGYVDQKEGRFFYDKNFGRQSRMWGTWKLWNKFNDVGLLTTASFSTKPQPEELVILKDDNKQKTQVGYRETKETMKWREDLERYNDSINKHNITVHLDGSVVVNNWFMVNYLYPNVLNHNIIIESISTTNNSILHNNYSYINLNHNPVIIKLPHHYNQQPVSINNSIFNILLQYTDTYTTTKPILTMTQMKSLKYTMDKGLQRNAFNRSFLLGHIFDLRASIGEAITQAEQQAILNQEYMLKDIGIQELVFTLEYEYLHRVFNRNSFKLGGRAYGALHQNLPRGMRRFIFINGDPTIDIDYTALHIMMLYHLEGIDYQDDPYTVCGGASMRKTYKAVALVAINAKDEKSAYGAIRDELKKRGIPLPDTEKPLVTLVRTFKDAHTPIGKYLFSDIGLTLQNYDSEIMNNVLVILMDNAIPALPVHDSMIVAEQHADILEKVMTGEYTKVMGFTPRLKRSDAEPRTHHCVKLEAHILPMMSVASCMIVPSNRPKWTEMDSNGSK